MKTHDFPLMDLEREVTAFKHAIELMQSQGYCIATIIFVKPNSTDPRLIDTAEVPGQSIELQPGVIQQVYKQLSYCIVPERQDVHIYSHNPFTDGIKPN